MPALTPLGRALNSRRKIVDVEVLDQLPSMANSLSQHRGKLLGSPSLKHKPATLFAACKIMTRAGSRKRALMKASKVSSAHTRPTPNRRAIEFLNCSVWASAQALMQGSRCPRVDQKETSQYSSGVKSIYLGSKTGCHTCGTFAPGTRSGNFVPDHQPPNALNRTWRAPNASTHNAFRVAVFRAVGSAATGRDNGNVQFNQNCTTEFSSADLRSQRWNCPRNHTRSATVGHAIVRRLWLFGIYGR